MSELEQIDNHVELAKELLIQQFKGAERLKAFISAFIQQGQNIEDMLIDLWQSRWIDNAEGNQLDGLGQIVGETRGGLSDIDYRIRLKVRIRINISSGLDSDISAVFSLLFEDETPPVRIVEYFPASLVMYMDEYVEETPALIANTLADVRATAVQAQLVYLSTLASGSFTCASADATESDDALGFTGAYDHIWDAHSASAVASWSSVCYSPELNLFFATSPSTNAMSSPDGSTWTAQTINSQAWEAVCWSSALGLFCAVSSNGTKRVATSPNGTTWTLQTTPTPARAWKNICWSPDLGLFCAVAGDALSNNIMTSPDGVTWTTRSNAGLTWQSVCWASGLGLFVAVSSSGTNRVITSPDGINWTQHAEAEANAWFSVCWSEELGLLVAVANSGTHRVMTSSDGSTWVAQTASEASAWRSVCWTGPLGLFIAVANSGTNRVMSSLDGVTWYSHSAAEANMWLSICWAEELGLLCAVANSGTNRVMTSDVDVASLAVGGEFADVLEA